jgi:hypothetical protein
MRTSLVCYALMALSVAAGKAAEDPASANFVLQHCKDVLTLAAGNPHLASPFQAGLCAGTVAGIATMGLIVRTEDPRGASSACLAAPRFN